MSCRTSICVLRTGSDPAFPQSGAASKMPSIILLRGFSLEQESIVLGLCLHAVWEALKQDNESPSLTMDPNWYCTMF